MNKRNLSGKFECSSTKAFEVIKGHTTESKPKINWASQALIYNQTRALSDNNYLKKANITIHKDAKWW